MFGSCRVLLLLLAAGVCSPTRAQDVPWQALSEGNTPWHSLQRARAALPAPGAQQLVGQLAAIVSDEALSCVARRRGPALPPGPQWQGALAVLDTAVASRRVVLLNESHDRGRHRAFLAQLIPLLHAHGFRALAAETFADNVADTLADGKVRASSGVYTRDPVFAGAVEQALALGWNVVAYEAFPAAGVADPRLAREQGQAARLAAWLHANPQQKLFAFVGGSHLDKRPEAGWMAAHLSALSGEVPLSIRQGATACPGDDPAHWPVASATGAMALIDVSREPSLEADWVVVHPPVPPIAERPGWLAALPGRQPIKVCLPELQQAALLRAFDERFGDEQVIANDQLPVGADQVAATLLLPVGRYRLELEEDSGERRKLGSVQVATAEQSLQSRQAPVACVSPNDAGH